MSENAETNALPGGCRLIALPEKKDERGCLSFLQSARDIPFDVQRVFWILNEHPADREGKHAG